MNFSNIDIVVLIGYLMIMMGFAIWIARKDKNENARDYFLASSSLPWWAVGGSLIASNISSEQTLISAHRSSMKQTDFMASRLNNLSSRS